MAASFFKCARVPRMLRSAPRKRRSALLIRGPTFHYQTKWVPALRRSVARCIVSGTRQDCGRHGAPLIRHSGLSLREPRNDERPYDEPAGHNDADF
jgi:hypothetical protein